MNSKAEMTISDAKEEESPSMTTSDSATRSAGDSYSYAPCNEFFTSTPYFGFGQTHLPPITSIYSPFAPYYGAVGTSTRFIMDPSSSSSLESTESSAIDQYSPPPVLMPITNTSVNNFDGSSHGRNQFFSLQSDSGISSANSSNGTPISRNAVRGYKKTYCSICKMHINKDGKRSQGPRRHLLQYHVRRPLFQCPHCSHASFYDKFHVTSHMRRIHQDNSERLINRSSEFEDEVEAWYERCFGERKTNAGSEMKQPSRKSPSSYTTRSSFSPPPVLTPEVHDQENVDPCLVMQAPELLIDTPLKAPVKRRKMGFMIDDILQPSPKKAVVTLQLEERHEK